MGQKLRVLSANLWKGGADPKAFSDLVAAIDPDVVAVQECTPEQAEAIGTVMPYGLMDPLTDPSGRTAGPSGEPMGLGLATKRPGEVHRLELPYRSAYRVQLNPADWPELSRPAEVLNVHFIAPHIVRPLPGVFQRPSQMREFLRQLDAGGQDVSEPDLSSLKRQGRVESCQRIIVGDFNATPLWPLYWRMASQFTDAAVAVARASGRRTQRTWGPGFGAPRLLRIDHGFVTKGMRVDEFEVVSVLGSDHSAIVMNVLLD